MYSKNSYSIKINPRSGNVERLWVKGDPEGINLVHTNVTTGFGMLTYTKNSDTPTIGPSESPVGTESVLLTEYRDASIVISSCEDRVVTHNPITGHTLTYELKDDYFDLWLDADIADADQIGLDLNVAFMDLRQNDPCDYQFNAKSPYRSEDRSLCYMYLERVKAPNMLITALSPCAGWRLCYNHYEHTVTGLQMLARFDSRLDPESKPEPVHFGVRVSFHEDLKSARSFIVESLGIPIITAPVLGGEIGRRFAFQVDGPAVGAELIMPDKEIRPVDLLHDDDQRFTGEVVLNKEGFYTLRVWNAEGRGSDLILKGSLPQMELLERSTSNLKPIIGAYCAEYWYWAQAFCLARKWFGANKRQDDYLYDALCTIGMQGVDFQGPPFPPAPEVQAEHLVQRKFSDAITLQKQNGWYLYFPCPEEHIYEGLRMSPFHLYMWERVQDAFVYMETYLYAADAFSNEQFYEHAIRMVDALLSDNIDENGKVHCFRGGIPIDYTTVIAPLQTLVELLCAMEKRGDNRADKIREVCLRVADYLMSRGFEFPTEGVSVQIRWTEDGSIACTALSLLFAYHFVEKRPEYLERATEILKYHEPWRMDVPDVRMLDSSYRYWETQWENDGEGRAINAGHAWTLWRAEALYYLALASGDSLALIQSYNGYQTNIAKFQADGTAFSCFTPDFIPARPPRFSLFHSYPQKPDPSLAFYLWPRIEQTWMRSAGIVDAVAVGYDPQLGVVGLNADVLEKDGILEITPTAPFFDRFFWMSKNTRSVRIFTDRQIEILFPPSQVNVLQGQTVKSEANLIVLPINNVIELML